MLETGLYDDDDPVIRELEGVSQGGALVDNDDIDLGVTGEEHVRNLDTGFCLEEELLKEG